jgi:PAS domain-containing protein
MHTEPRRRNGNASRHQPVSNSRELNAGRLLTALQAVRGGDFTVRLPGDWTGLDGKIADTFNEIVAANEHMARELERVGHLVGKQGRTRQRLASVLRQSSWGRMEVAVNTLIDDLCWPTAEMTRAIGAVAKGDLSQTVRLDVDGRPLEGEFLRSATIVNTMIQQMSAFTSEVTRVAREVGTEGKLGGQANVPGAAGTWKDLTANVNLLAANLTTQVRAVAAAATAVTKGDLTRFIQVDTRGEVSDLKDNINAMIGDLRATTDRNNEQDWLKTNLAKFSRMMQGQRDLITVGRMLLSELVPLVGAQRGVMYAVQVTDEEPFLTQLAAYADDSEEGTARRYAFGEGVVGQCAIERQRIVINDIPQDSIAIHSGLVVARPRAVIVLPVIFETQVKAVIELASLGEFTASHIAFLEQLTGSIGVVLNTIEATMRTEDLLKQSQQLADVNARLKQEIYERVRIEEALEREGARYQALVQATAQIVWTADADGRIERDIATAAIASPRCAPSRSAGPMVPSSNGSG